MCAGCALLAPPREQPVRALPEIEARQAGALALYGKGLLLESGEGADTNLAKQAAEQAFAQALRLDPDSRRTLAALLSNLTERGRYAEAQDAAEQYLARHPDDLEFRLEAARAADATNRPADAARHCAALLAAQPENRELAHSLVRLYFLSEQEQQALRLMREQHARYRDSDSAALPVHWAAHYAQQGRRPARALACVELALGLRTGVVERAALTAFAGECQLLLGRTNQAVDTLMQAYRSNPAYSAPLLRVGAVFAADPAATNRLAAEVVRAADRDTALLVLAATQQALGDDAAAAATLREAHESRMRNGFFPDEGFYLWLASLHEARRARGEAERLLREGLAAHPGAHEMKNFLAYMWAEDGVRLDEANRLANEALAAQPDNPAYLDTKGWVLLKLGRAYDALQLLLRAAELDREEPVILDHVGDALIAIGREREALSFWERSHRFDPQPAVADKLKKHGVTPLTP